MNSKEAFEKQPTIHEGWKLVPIEPTAEMIAAGAWMEYFEESSNMHMVDDEDVVDVYKAMLSAAPEYKLQGDEE